MILFRPGNACLNCSLFGRIDAIASRSHGTLEEFFNIAKNDAE